MIPPAFWEGVDPRFAILREVRISELSTVRRDHTTVDCVVQIPYGFHTSPFGFLWCRFSERCVIMSTDTFGIPKGFQTTVVSLGFLWCKFSRVLVVSFLQLWFQCHERNRTTYGKPVVSQLFLALLVRLKKTTAGSRSAPSTILTSTQP